MRQVCLPASVAAPGRRTSLGDGAAHARAVTERSRLGGWGDWSTRRLDVRSLLMEVDDVVVRFLVVLAAELVRRHATTLSTDHLLRWPFAHKFQ